MDADGRRFFLAGGVIWQAVALLGASLVLGLVTKWVHPKAPAWSIHSEPLLAGEVLPATIEEEFGGDVLWIDARPEEQYLEDHIPGALLINPQDTDNQLFEHFEQIQTETRPVVVYCGSRGCKASKTVADYLRENTILDPILVLKLSLIHI